MSQILFPAGLSRGFSSATNVKNHTEQKYTNTRKYFYPFIKDHSKYFLGNFWSQYIFGLFVNSQTKVEFCSLNLLAFVSQEFAIDCHIFLASEQAIKLLWSNDEHMTYRQIVCNMLRSLIGLLSIYAIIFSFYGYLWLEYFIDTTANANARSERNRRKWENINWITIFHLAIYCQRTISISFNVKFSSFKYISSYHIFRGRYLNFNGLNAHKQLNIYFTINFKYLH